MSRVSLIAVAVLLMACDKKTDSPTAPRASATKAEKSVATTSASRQSAVCKSYQKQQAMVKAQRGTRATDARLKSQDSVLAVIIADACP
jgi:hypothetical protein